MENFEIRQTNDGSKTIYLSSIDETYHSSHGAVQEAKHVFLEHGLSYVDSINDEEINVFEMGFGTGLNALLTATWSMKKQRKVNYTGIELYPVPEIIWQQMDYAERSEDEQLYIQLMKASWEKDQNIHPYFQLRKINENVKEVKLDTKVDLIFYDAFGPRAQAEMWELPILTKMHELLKTGGVFVTYCAQGQMKRNLTSLGFTVESLPGPPGKREMTRAIKN